MTVTIGLTGSIGMGKSTVGVMFQALGAHYWDADGAVHRLYNEGGAAVPLIAEAFPGAIRDNAVDRTLLAKEVLGDPAKLQRLEALVHPLVGQDREEFLADAIKAGAEAVVLDIPLLFESGAGELFDAIVVVSAPYTIQRERVLARPGMSHEKFEAILAQQIPDEEKRARADFIVETDVTLEETQRNVENIYRQILDKVSSST